MPPGFDIQAPLFGDFVRLNGKWLPDKVAFLDEEQALTWAALDRRSNAVAHGLRAMGVGRGDAIAILMRNCVEFVEVMVGGMKAGGVIVPLNPAVSDADLLAMIEDCDAKALFVSSEQYERLKDSGAVRKRREATFVLGPAAGAACDYEAWRDAQAIHDPGVTVGEDDPCNIIYSSGTTGTPKGIKHAYRRRVQSMYELALAHRYHFGAVSICPIGLYSNIAWASIFCTIIVGGACIVRNRFDPEIWLSAVETHGVTHTFMAPIMFQRILDAPGFSRSRVRSLQAVMSGGAPLFEDLKSRIKDAFECVVIELYGLTEGFMTTLQPEEAAGRTASVGKPVRGNDYILVDTDDRVLGWGETGEICVRSVHWMTEYHNRPEATAQAKFVDPAGTVWLRTGDIGRTDAEGYLYITDRKKDMILTGGQNIYPVDIEAVMSQHPALAEVAVIGVADRTWGETPLAVAVLRPGFEGADAAEIASWTNARVGRRQRISRVVFRQDLPRNPNGKVLKRVLRADYDPPQD